MVTFPGDTVGNNDSVGTTVAPGTIGGVLEPPIGLLVGSIVTTGEAVGIAVLGDLVFRSKMGFRGSFG